MQVKDSDYADSSKLKFFIT